jgi:hypothetical protein
MDLRGRNWQKTGERLHCEELHNLYTSSNIEKNETGGAYDAHESDAKRVQNFGRKIWRDETIRTM